MSVTFSVILVLVIVLGVLGFLAGAWLGPARK